MGSDSLCVTLAQITINSEKKSFEASSSAYPFPVVKCAVS